MTALLIKDFLRSKGLIVGLSLLFLVGLMSLYIGKVFLKKQALIIEKTAEFQKENIDRHLKHVDGDLGLLMYYIRFGLVNETPALAGLSIGHRDIHPNVVSVNIRNLEEQKYTSELINPMYQQLGNLDFSFVLIYLFPLIIIAFCFNLLSEEKENGTWQLVLSQSKRPLNIIQNKLLIRLISVLTVLFALLIIAKIYLSIPLDPSFLAYTLMATVYICFWFALTWFVISLQKSSNQNALLLLLTWVLLTIIIPACTSAIMTTSYPIPEAYSSMLESRDGYHNKWDEPKAPTIKKFVNHYPQFSEYKHPEGKNFSWFWYFAMQQMGDDEAAEASRATKEKLELRDRFSRMIAYFFPSIHTQFSLNTFSKSDMTNYIHYMSYLEDFHEKKRLHFYPKIFENAPLESENWEDIKLEHFQDIRSINWLISLLPLLVLSGLLIVGARINFKN